MGVRPCRQGTTAEARVVGSREDSRRRAVFFTRVPIALAVLAATLAFHVTRRATGTHRLVALSDLRRPPVPVACVLAVSDTFDESGERERIDDRSLLEAAERMGAAAVAALSA